MTAKEKNRLAGIFLMVHGGLLGGIMLLLSLMFVFALSANPAAPRGIFVFFTVFMAVWSLIFIIPQLLGGWKMYKEDPKAKNWGIVAAILACMNAPLGTAAGVFTLIFIFGDDGRKFYDQQETQKFIGRLNQVDDFSHQDFQTQRREPHSWK